MYWSTLEVTCGGCFTLRISALYCEVNVDGTGAPSHSLSQRVNIFCAHINVSDGL